MGSTSLLILFLFLSLSDSSCFVGFEFGVADFEVFEVFLGFCDDDACEAQEGNKVRDGHEAVDDICECPDGFEFQEGSGCEDDEKEDSVEEDALGAEEVFPAAFAVVVPSEDGGEGEECERYGEKNRREAAIGDGKCVLCKFSAVGVTEPLAGYDDGKTGQGTNDDGVDEGTGHGNEALFCRPFCFSGSSDDRCGA